MAAVSPDLLAACLAEVDSGRKTAAQCATEHPEVAEELRSLLELARAVDAPSVTPDPAFRARVRTALLQELDQEGARRRRLLSPLFRIPRPALAATVAALGLTLAGGGVLYASQSALPGDPLYPVKTSIEQLHLTVAPDSSARARAYLDIADARADEVQQAVRDGRAGSARTAADGYARDMQQARANVAAAGSNGKDTSALQAQLETAIRRQQVELESVEQQAPTPARAAIAQAVDAAAQAQPAAVPSPTPAPAVPSTTPAAAPPLATPGPSSTPAAAGGAATAVRTPPPLVATAQPVPTASGTPASGLPAASEGQSVSPAHDAANGAGGIGRAAGSAAQAVAGAAATARSAQSSSDPAAPGARDVQSESAAAATPAPADGPPGQGRADGRGTGTPEPGAAPAVPSPSLPVPPLPSRAAPAATAPLPPARETPRPPGGQQNANAQGVGNADPPQNNRGGSALPRGDGGPADPRGP